MNAGNLRTPLKQARGLGSARDGTHHFIVQRITAIALVPLTIWAVYVALALVHADYAAARALVHQPCSAIALSALVIALFWHTQLGIQVVLEDYVHTRWLEVTAQLAVRFFCAVGAIACLYAIVRVAL